MTQYQWISIPDAAHHLGVSERMVRKMIAQGKLRCWVISERRRLVWVFDVMERMRPTETTCL